jgi:hypothetical protein
VINRNFFIFFISVPVRWPSTFTLAPELRMKSKSEAAQHEDALGVWSEEADRKEAHHGGVAAALSRLQPGEEFGEPRSSGG